MSASVLKRTIMRAIGLGLLTLPLVSLGGPGARVDTPAAVPLWRIDGPGVSASPCCTTMREAAFWWGQALQIADDEADQARAALQTWDPAAPFDRDAERLRALMADGSGYRRRAAALLAKAGRLASTPAERLRVEHCRQRWARATLPHPVIGTSRFLYN